MIRTLIVDDEPLAHDVVKTYMSESPQLELIGQAYSATEALAFLKHTSVDLILLDIEMPVLNGLEFLSMLKQRPQIIITSAYQEYAVEGFDMDVTDYLLKPFRFDRFMRAIDKVKQKSALSQTSNNETHSQIKSIFIKVDKKQVQLQLADICYFEAYGNYVKVWQGERAFLTPKTLSSFEQKLSKDQFVRIHKSIIINREKIHSIEGDTVVLLGGNTVSIGKQYKINLKLDSV